MDSTKKIILNTIVQYSRSILNIFLSLFSTRYIVEALGKSDYGIYLLVGGVVALLGFITNALVATTQRHVSYYFGQKSAEKVKMIFANSLFVHIAVSAVMLLILFSLRNVVIFHMLNIPEGRETVAMHVYEITMLLLIATIMIAPYKALFIARENITYISVMEVTDGFLKLGIALWVLNSHSDKLLLYAFLMLMIQCFNFLALFGYAFFKFDEARVFISSKNINGKSIRQLLGFAGWSTYGMGTVVVRSQGIQWMLNRMFDTVMNAAYGIGIQVYGSVSFVASSVLNAMNPQIIKAEGENDRARMLYLAEMESKYSTMLLILIVIPIIIEMPSVLQFWLSDDSEYTSMFCRFILLGFIFDQATYGINTANQAMGRIRTYNLLMYTPKLLALVPIYFLLRAGKSPFCVMWVYLLSEVLVSFARLPYLKYVCGLRIMEYVRVVFAPLLPLLLSELLIGWMCKSIVSGMYRFLMTIPVSVVGGMVVVWFFSLTGNEKSYIRHLVGSKLRVRHP